MAKTAQENAGYRRGGLVGDAKSPKFTTSVTQTTTGSARKVTKTQPSRPKGIIIKPGERPTRPPIPIGSPGGTKGGTRKTVTVGAKSKAPSRASSAAVLHVNAPPKPKKKPS